MASSSSSHQEIVEYQEKKKRSTASSKIYDAFISHRGPDVKETLAKQLYQLLRDRGIRAFLDRPEIEVGDSILSAIESAICSSIVQIAIFSKGYAHSSWCLDELVLMLNQRDHNGSLFIPVFYDVEPSDLRYIEKGVYAAEFSEYERKGRSLDKLDGWKKALDSASKIAGFELCRSGDNLCKEIVSCVEKEIKRRIPLHVASYPVGLGELVRDFERRFGEPAKERVKMVGIFGLGGSGKTTLAKAIFNKKSLEYDKSSFLYDVRESHAKRELHVLQRKLLEDLFIEYGEDREYRHTEERTAQLMHRLKRAQSFRFLIILDDVDHEDQLQALLFQDLLSPGSLVILTTRDKGVLIGAEISNCYPLKTMDNDRAKELFCSHAFGGKEATFPCEQLVERFVKVCGGLPLSLKVLGNHVRGRDENFWMLELEKARDIPPKDVLQCLKISYKGLEKEEKQIFIDIACFFIGRGKDRAVKIWKATEWTTAEHAVQRLLDKCLVEVEDVDSMWLPGPLTSGRVPARFRMHDHLRDLGRQMAEKKVPRRLWRTEHLISMREKGFQKILEETSGRCYDMFKDSYLNFEIEYLIGNSNNYAGTSTPLLWLGVRMYKGNKIPLWFPVRQLKDLYAEGVGELWSVFPGRIDTQDSFQLRQLHLQGCSGLQKIPDLIKTLYHLKVLIIKYHSLEYRKAQRATALLKSIAKLSNLKILEISYVPEDPFYADRSWQIFNVPVNGELFFSNLSNLETLKIFHGAVNGELFLSNSSCMTSLRKIYFSHQNFPKLVISGELCPSLNYLEIYASKLTEMDLKLVQTLKVLLLHGCSDLKTISGLSGVTSLEELTIRKCPQLKNIGDFRELEGFKFLEIELICHAGVLNFICGLKKLPSQHIMIRVNYMTEEGLNEAVRRLNVNLFSDVIGGHAIIEIQSIIDNPLKLEEIRTSSTAFIVCASWKVGFSSELEVRVVRAGQVTESAYFIPGRIKGFVATVNKDEEWKALRLFNVIIECVYSPVLLVETSL